ncbi:MAG TPA: acetyl-CoA carboxylase biotin carboxyl carrier protein [Polyangiaceae bacterium]|nr:acetyl-CoA carboxylase biotin carboxyl carrier protein [Polyangiaceae bacterium]
MDIDLKQLKELMRSLKQFEITELEVEKNGERIKLCRGSDVAATPFGVVHPAGHTGHASPPPASIAPAAAALSSPPAASVDDGSVHYITSPFVGTFYSAPTPGAESFVKVGSEVKPGQTLCIVEAMKLMNEIESDVAGTILEVLRENGKPVEYGDKLFKVKKS